MSKEVDAAFEMWYSVQSFNIHCSVCNDPEYNDADMEASFIGGRTAERARCVAAVEMILKSIQKESEEHLTQQVATLTAENERLERQCKADHIPMATADKIINENAILTSALEGLKLDVDDWRDLQRENERLTAALEKAREALTALGQEAASLYIPEAVPEAFKERIWMLKAHIEEVAALAALSEPGERGKE